MFKKVLVHARRGVKLIILFMIAIFLIIGAVAFLYKPTYSVYINGQQVGYTSNKSDLQHRINEYVDHGDGTNENVAFVQVDQLPEYKLCLLKRNIVTNDEEVYNKVTEQGIPYYRYYAILEEQEEKYYVSTFEEAENVVNTLKDKMQYSLMSFNQEKIVKAYKEYSYEESIEDEEKRHVMSEVAKSYYKMNEIGNEIITSCIKEIKLPDDTFISDRDMIYEFVTNTKSSIITNLHDKIKEINDIGLPTTLNYRCSCCNHEWEEKFYGFNQVDFFGIGS